MNPRRLTDDERAKLSPWIPGIDLEAARIHSGGIVLEMMNRADGILAITLHNDIYLEKDDPSNPENLCTICHECIHIGQYREGMNYETYLLSCKRGYDNSPFEQAAYAIEAKIRESLK